MFFLCNRKDLQLVHRFFMDNRALIVYNNKICGPVEIYYKQAQKIRKIIDILGGSDPMKGLKKVTCGLLAAAMAAGMTGCMDASWIVKSDETKIPAGVYTANLLQNYIYGYMLGGGSAYLEGEGIKEELVNGAKEYTETILAYQKKANELGLALTEEEKTSINESVEEEWTNYGALYEANRVSEDAVRMTHEISILSNKVFTAIYGEGGEKEVPVEELRSIYDENYLKAGLMIFSKPTKTELSSEATEEEKKEVEETYNNSMEELKTEVDQWVKNADNIMNTQGLTFNDVIIAYDFENTPIDDNSDINVGDRYAYIDKTDDTIPPEVIKHLETAEFNAVEVVETEEYFVICCRQDGANDESFESIRDTILYDLKGEEMMAMMDEYIAAMNVVYNDAAMKRFDPSKLVMG